MGDRAMSFNGVGGFSDGNKNDIDEIARSAIQPLMEAIRSAHDDFFGDGLKKQLKEAALNGVDPEVLRSIDSASVREIQGLPNADSKSADKSEISVANATAFAVDLEEAPKADVLPPNWNKAVDTEGDTYYWHVKTGETSWYKPLHKSSIDNQADGNGSSKQGLAQRLSSPRSDDPASLLLEAQQIVGLQLSDDHPHHRSSVKTSWDDVFAAPSPIPSQKDILEAERLVGMQIKTLLEDVDARAAIFHENQGLKIEINELEDKLKGIARMTTAGGLEDTP